jgi:hypothetical protein
MTLDLILNICKRDDKVTEGLVPYFNILLPSIEVLKNKYAADFGKAPKKNLMSSKF